MLQLILSLFGRLADVLVLTLSGIKINETHVMRIMKCKMDLHQMALELISCEEFRTLTNFSHLVFGISMELFL